MMYIIQLDKKDRWTKVINDHKEKCINILNSFETMIDNDLMGNIMKNIALFIIRISKSSAMYLQEIESIANILEIPTEKVILAQLMYEFCANCTSAMVEHEGQNVHYRTLDWGLPQLKDLTVELIFQRNEKTVFRATSWAGYVGIMTGMTYHLDNNYTLALNYRNTNGTLFNSVQRTIRMYYPIGYLIRNTLESSLPFEEALDILKNAQLISPCYLTICTMNEKLIIVRNCKDGYTIRKKNKRYPDHLCQTNIDPGCHDEDKNILSSIERRKKVESIFLNNEWKNMDDILRSFHVYPINNEITIYETIMNPGTGYYKTNIMN